MCEYIDMLKAGLCNDGDPCTVSGCDPEAGCTSICDDEVWVDDCPPCGWEELCDDGNPCTIDSWSWEYWSCAIYVADCDDNIPCTLDSCDENAAEDEMPCVHNWDQCQLCVEDADCPQPDDCCQERKCHWYPEAESGVCEAWDKFCQGPCNDHACNIQTCECEWAGTGCNDFNPCTVDSCGGETGCVHAAVEDGEECGDPPGCLCETGQCLCPPPCGGKECGNDGQGGTCGDCPNGKQCNDGLCVSPGMVGVLAGPFMMGCNHEVDWDCSVSEDPYHQVHIGTFEIDATEVTVLEYGGCVVDFGACSQPSTSLSGCNWGQGKPDHPVNCVDWFQAKAYCEWAGKRLCTEAEWEKAARGLDGRVYPWGNEEPACEHAVIPECSDSSQPVGTKPAGASPYGLLDMAGNVREWVQDCWLWGYNMAPNDGSANELWCGEEPIRVLRSSSYDIWGDTHRTSERHYLPATTNSDNNGIRCCRSKTYD